MIPVVGAPIGQRARLVLELLEVSIEMRSFLPNLPLYLARVFAHSMFS